MQLSRDPTEASTIELYINGLLQVPGELAIAQQPPLIHMESSEARVSTKARRKKR